MVIDNQVTGKKEVITRTSYDFFFAGKLNTFVLTSFIPMIFRTFRMLSKGSFFIDEVEVRFGSIVFLCFESYQKYVKKAARLKNNHIQTAKTIKRVQIRS